MYVLYAYVYKSKTIMLYVLYTSTLYTTVREYVLENKYEVHTLNPKDSGIWESSLACKIRIGTFMSPILYENYK